MKFLSFASALTRASISGTRYEMFISEISYFDFFLFFGLKTIFFTELRVKENIKKTLVGSIENRIMLSARCLFGALCCIEMTCGEMFREQQTENILE